MKSRFKFANVSLMCCALAVSLVFSLLQLVNAQDIGSYNASEVQLYASAGLEGQKPDTKGAFVKTYNITEGNIQFSLINLDGTKFDILRSDNGEAYIKLTDFPLGKEVFADKYTLAGHTYYYIVSAYDSNGKILYNYGPYKAITSKASGSSKKVELQLDNEKAMVNGVEKTLDVKPYVLNGRTLVPLRFISEALGAQLDWNASEKKITLVLNGNTVKLWIGSSQAEINNATVFLDVPAQIYNNRTVVPVRFVSEKLKLNVEFNDKTKKITITNTVSDSMLTITPAKVQQTPTPTATPTPTPQATPSKEDILKAIVRSSDKHSGESIEGTRSTSFSIQFKNYDELTGTFEGEIEWIGYNVTDDIEGNYLGDKITFTQVLRHQGGTTSRMNATTTATVGSDKRVSGSWVSPGEGRQGTLWFEYSLPATTLQKVFSNSTVYKGAFSYDGLPNGQATVEFGNNITFTGDVKVESGNCIATGTINYPDSTTYSGQFINGKPQGLGTLSYPDKTAYLVDFTAGEPIDFYVATTIPQYVSSDIEIYRAKEIEFYQSTEITSYTAKEIEPYKAKIIDQYKAKPVDKYDSKVTMDMYEAKIIELNPPGAFNGNDNLPIGSFKTPDYMNPLVQIWTAHMVALPYLIYGGFSYR